MAECATPVFYSLSGKVRVSAFLLSEPTLFIAEIVSAPGDWSIILDAEFETAPLYAAKLGSVTLDINKAIASALDCDAYAVRP